MKDLKLRLVWAVRGLPDLAATVQGWRLGRQRFGPVFRVALAEIIARESWSPERMAAYVDEQLRALVRLAATRVPYYRALFRRLGLHPDDIRTVTDLTCLPVLEKQVVRETPELLVDETLAPAELRRGSTSGTTGTPLRLFHTDRTIQLNYAYYHARCLRVAGIEFGRRPYVMLGGRRLVPPGRSKPPFWCYNYAWKQLYMSSYHLSRSHLGAYVAELRRRPYCGIMGFPSSLYALAQYVLEHGEEPLRLGTATTSGEMLYPEHRAVIERGLGVRVFDQYGCNECAVFAVEGPDGQMYVSPDYGIVEVLGADGQPLPAGEVGELVCTSLINHTQVFLRYRIGDRGALEPSRSPDRPAFPILRRLEGRSNAALVLRDGRRITRLGPALSGVAHIRECQIVQEDWDRFCVRIVPARGYQPHDGEQICRNLTGYLGPVDVRVVLEEQIERTRGGKFETLVCRLTPEQLAEVR
jgi:phenylacetate-CoA ligase